MSSDAARGGPFRRPLDSRDQVRWLPYAGAPARRTACHLHTAGPRLDAALPADRRCARGPPGAGPDPGRRSRGGGFARHPRFRTAVRRPRRGPSGPAALLRIRPALSGRLRSAGGAACRALLREAICKGRREDRELPPARPRARTLLRTADNQPRTGVPRANILQLLPDAVPPSKEELATYWKKVWKRAFAYLGQAARARSSRQRHEVLSIGEPPPVPETGHKLTIAKREGGEGTRL